MSDKFSGKCLCGASSYEFDGDIQFAIRCYCRDCQHVSGGGHAPQFAVSKDQFRAEGPVKAYSQLSDAGNELLFSFCADCGSPLFKQTALRPEVVFIYPGSVVEPLDVDFGTAIFESSRASWDKA